MKNSKNVYSYFSRNTMQKYKGHTYYKIENF